MAQRGTLAKRVTLWLALASFFCLSSALAITNADGLIRALISRRYDQIKESEEDILDSVLTLELCQSDIVGRDIDDEHYSATILYMLPVSNGKLGKRCLDLGFNLQQPIDGSGRTLLDHPMVLWSPDFLKSLLDRGADVGMPSMSTGEPPLCTMINELSESYGEHKMESGLTSLELLTAYAPTMDLRCNDGRTALFRAIELRLPEASAILCRRGANLAASEDEDRHTPMHLLKRLVYDERKDQRVLETARMIQEVIKSHSEKYAG